MNARSIVAAALLIPLVAGAQRRTNVGRTPVGPTPLPKEAPTLAREMSYVPRPYSLESYMFTSFVQAPSAIPGKSFAYGTLAAGERLDYRLGQHFSATGEVTSTFFGGPQVTMSYELGGRFLPIKRDNMTSFRPYLDARWGYFISGINSRTNNPGSVDPAVTMRFRTSRGAASILGGGMEKQITQSLWLTTGAWWAESNMRAYSSSDLYNPGTGRTGRMRQYRLALGFKWNPMRTVMDTQ